MPEQLRSKPSTPQLQRELGIWDVGLLSLSSMLGTGGFISIGIVAGVAGSYVVLAIVIAAIISICNGLSSAQLVANHAVRGGTYEYGYRYLTPWLGFIAGWTFLLGMSALAATAALGLAGYALSAIAPAQQAFLIPAALITVLVAIVVVQSGVQRSSVVNPILVSITLLTLLVLVLVGLPRVMAAGDGALTPTLGTVTGAEYSLGALLQATAMMVVAYTGYGPITTLGEAVQRPKRTLPSVIFLTIAVAMLLYVGVALVGVGTVGTSWLFNAAEAQAASLNSVARSVTGPAAPLFAIGAIAGMVGVLLNLLVALSRVLLAMGQRHDVPFSIARLDTAETAPVAVWLAGGAIALVVLVGNVQTIWSLSTFAILMYSAITNGAALKLSEQRQYPRWVAYFGLAACLFLAFWVEWDIWLPGCVLTAIALVWHGIMRWSQHQSNRD